MRRTARHLTEDSTELLGAQERGVPVAGRLGHGFAQLASDIRAFFEATVPALRGDDDEWRRLEGSIEHDLDLAAASEPTAMLDYARHLVGRGVSPLVIIRAYRAGQRCFLRRTVERLVRAQPQALNDARETLDTIDRVSAYVDDVVEQMIAAYVEARKEWLDPEVILRARVRSVIDDRDLDISEAQSRLGSYRVCQHHLGVELWTSRRDLGDATAELSGLTDALASALALNDRPLFVRYNERSACAWLPMGERTQIDIAALPPVIASVEGANAAIGEVASGLAGFRRTHQQAVSAEAVARINDPPLERLTTFADVAPIATMANDIDAARAWVRETLGELAIDDDRHEMFRETARVFLATGGSYAATADRLFVHRNTAQYRVRTAEAMRGRPFRDDRLDVELALLASRWFGAAVLRPAATSARRSLGGAS
jgi:PucR C-terminal helix-turn-helix domain/GGDEF-like domain